MYLGEYEHNIDSKGRIFMPARFRETLGDTFVIARSVDPCLTVYPIAKWTVLTEKIAALPELDAKKLGRFLFPSAVEAVPDTQGRFLLPLNLRQYAKLGKNITIIGMGDYIEIWNGENLGELRSEENADDIKELMRSLNF